MESECEWYLPILPEIDAYASVIMNHTQLCLPINAGLPSARIASITRESSNELSRQQVRPARQTVCRLRPSHGLAQEVAVELGCREVLFGCLPA